MTDDELVEALAPIVWASPWRTADALTIAREFVPIVRELAQQLAQLAPLVAPLVDPPGVVPPPTPGGGDGFAQLGWSLLSAVLNGKPPKL